MLQAVLKLFTEEAFYKETINISKRYGTRNKYSYIHTYSLDFDAFSSQHKLKGLKQLID